MSTPWENFKRAARREPLARVPVALIVDRPGLPDYAGLETSQTHK